MLRHLSKIFAFVFLLSTVCQPLHADEESIIGTVVGAAVSTTSLGILILLCKMHKTKQNSTEASEEEQEATKTNWCYPLSLATVGTTFVCGLIATGVSISDLLNT
jgi:hypothetical protein